MPPGMATGLALTHLYFSEKRDRIHLRGVGCDPVYRLDHSVAWLDVSVTVYDSHRQCLCFNTV